ncbi:MAG: T9SS type B sorting domain-containing protein [Paludibacteraceae bacterium]|nr:T9SS type B sorting domain-containing protein [Paludibacteraceae bacterium]
MKFMSYYSAIILRTFMNRFFKMLLFISFLILPTVAFGGSWNVVWQEDFGVVEDSVCRDFADPNMSVPGHKVADKALMADGYYGITNSTEWCFVHKKDVNISQACNFVPGRDHTGNKNGGMLVVNVGGRGNGENIYENNLKLKPCGDHKYRLSMFVANVSDAPLSPDLTLQVYNVKDAANPKLLESVNISGSDIVAWPRREKSLGIYTHKERDWSEAYLEFEAKSGDELKIVIENNCSSGNGNDFALDDITLQRYDDDEIVPPIIEIETSMTNSSCVPTYSVNNLEALDSWKNIYKSVYFLWQYSTDDGYTWTNISGESGIEKTYLQRDLQTTGNEVYRLIITGGSDDSEAQSKAEYIAKYETPDDGCDYFSISNIISQMEIKNPPVAYLGIDNDITITNQPQYDCENIDHFVSLMADEWDVNYSKFYFLWQYSYDETTWTDLPFTGSDFQFTDDFDGLTYFRVILAANENTLLQVAKNGTPDNCDKDYFITNTVSIECLKSCEKPEFEILSDKIKFICKNSGDLVEWNVRQTNQTKTTDIEWYSKPIGANSWTLIAGEKGESIKNLNTNDTTSYLLLAKNGKCVSDSIIFEVIVIPPFIFEPIGDIPLCEGTDIIFTPDVTTRTLSPITFFWDGVPTTDEYYKVVVTEDKSLSFYATDGVCTSNEVYANFIVEKEADVTLQPLPAVICEGEKVDLIAEAKFAPFNTFKWEKDGVLFNNTDLITSDIPHENTFYKFIVEGDLCPTIEYILGVDVEKKAEMTLQPLPAVVCKGEKIDLVADVQLPSSNAYKWEKNGSLLSDVDLVTTDIPEENATYKFTILGDACPDIEDKMIVEVESMADVTLQPLPAIICEGEKVDLIADAKLTSTNAFKWEKGNDLISDADLSTSDIPTEDATYKFTITGDKCPAIEKEVSVKVEKKAEVTLEPLPAIICEGTDVDLVADVKLTSANTFKWEKGNDLLTDIGLKTTDIPTEDATYKFTITGEKCPAIEEEVSVKVEKIAEVTLQPLPAIICEGEKVDLIADANISSTNRFKWERGNELISDADLSTTDNPTEDATYKFTITGDKCPAIEKEISVKVEKKAEVTLQQPQPSVVCVGEEIDLIADAQLTSANTFKWEDGKGQLLGDADLKISVIPAEDDTYKFTVYGDKCPAIENEVSVKVEKIAEVTLQPLPAVICEGEKVDLIADASLTSANSFKWERGNELISDVDLSTSDIPTENATYKFTITGDKCPAIEKEVSVKVEKKAELSLSISDTEVCENTSVALSVNATNAPKLVWKQKNDGESQFSEMSESGDVVNITATKSATFIVESSDELACQRAVSNEVSLFVEEPVSVSLKNVPTEVCEGTIVLLDASITENCTSYGWKKNENENFAKNELFAEDVPTETTTYEFWAKPLVCPAFSEKFVVDVEHVKNVELTASESNICKGGDVTLTTNYPYVEGVVWESKGENESQFSKVDEGVSEIVVSPSDNTTYRVSAISKLGCGEKGSEQEIEVTQPVGLSVEDVSICEGDAAHLEAVTERAYDRIEWKIEGDSSVNKVGSFVDLTPESTITYNVVAYSHNCLEEVNATITVAPIPRISSHEELGNHTYQMIVENTNETLYFDYHNGDGKTISNLLENAVVGKFYDVEVSDSLGCSSSYLFQVPFVEPEFPIYFYQGDENWQVKNIENYPNSTLYIYDRFGKLLFKEKGNTDGWSGEYNGRRLPSTDYWYILDIPEIDKQYEGHFTLMRR